MTRTVTLAGVALAAAAAFATGPASAQVQQGNPNAANESMSTMSTTRSMQQGATSQNNTTMMNTERSQNAPALPPQPSPIPRAGAAGR